MVQVEPFIYSSLFFDAKHGNAILELYDMSEEPKKESKGNPLLGFLDNVLSGARKMINERGMLKASDEITYFAIRKLLDGLKNTFVPMKIDGAENVPAFKPAIISSVVSTPVELGLAVALTPRKVHMMVPAKMFNTPGLKPILESVGAYRSTESQDDMEPVQRTVEFLTKDKDLVAMIPIDNGDREASVKQMAGILKFCAGVPCPLVPFASTSLNKFKLGKTISIKVLDPVEVKSNIKRDERYELAGKIVDSIMAEKAQLEQEREE